MRNEINFLDKRRDQEDTWLGRSNARIRDCGIQNDGKTREHHLHVAFLLCPTCVFQRGQKSRLFTRGSGSGHGNGPSAVSSRRPFQKFRRRHTDSPASSYELASSAQSSFRFFRMEWPAFDPRTAKGCLICWTGRRRHSVLLSSLLLWKLGSGGGNSRKRYLVRGKKNRSSLNRSIYYYSFIPLHGKEKKKKDLFEICIIPEERENIDEYSLSIILQENIISSLLCWFLRTVYCATRGKMREKETADVS